MEIMLLILAPLILCPVIAGYKKRNVGGWFFGGLTIGWIGVIIVACLPALSSRPQHKTLHLSK